MLPYQWLFIASLLKNIDYDNFEIKNIKTDNEIKNLDIESSIEIIFDKKFTSYISTSFKKNFGNKTLIYGEDGEIILENSWNCDQGQIEVKGKNPNKYNVEISKNIYSLEIENISNDILNNRFEASFPGMNKKEIYNNSKLLNKWINE